jgi:oligopeptide transport system substrate-binding protein
MDIERRSLDMKRHNQRNSLVFALLLAFILPILAACGSQPAAAPNPASEPTSAPAPNTSQAPTAAPAAAPQPTSAPAATATGNTSASSGGAASGVLRVAQTSWPDTMDPQDSSVANEIAVEILNYEGLTRFDKDLKTVPAAAEKWDSNQDATEFTFHLRDGLKYSDGSPLVAQDFVNAVYRSLDPRGTIGDYQGTFFMVKGADAILNTAVPTDEAKVPDLFKQLGVTAPDDKTIKFELSQPTPYFPTLAALWVIFPAKQALVEKGGDQWYEDAANQVGNGPFQITKIDQSANLIEFAPNPNYWAGAPKLPGVEFKFIQDLSVALQAYKNNEVDIIVPDPNDVPAIKADATLGKEYIDPLGACTESYELNNTKPPFDNKKVRQAFATGFDRESYIRDALKDTSAKTLTWIPPGYPGFDKSENRWDYSPDKAKQLLAEAGFPNGQGLPEVKISYNSDTPANQARIEYIIQMYQKSLGVTLVPDPIEGKTLNSLRKDVTTAPQIVSGGGWCADYPDPQDWLSIFWHSRSQFAKNIGYHNAEADKLMDQADIETDPAKRMALYDQVQKIIIDDVPYIIRSTSKGTFLVKPYVKGLEITPQDSNTYPGMTTSLFNVTVEK